ncbi:toll/interleukin-1 receptor domain-containing protein [Coraliomargarita parva]|uniref:toll/interleukin-1 receptor domain-containing protein n=1 Tax=Coraliomargarita parva TaxID=3014050 RepID=UPI0022B55403|nr:toll/interleukin-1 receptor domain-containing protein [Coraliomargarita parva]
MSTPKVFISYSHDSQKHKQWVLQLATRLRNNGVDAALDQWDLSPGDDLPHFMEQNLTSCDYALMICTQNYVSKANNGTGGVGYEKMILTADLLSRIDSRKVIPIIRQDGGSDVPTFLKTKLYIDFSHSQDFEFSFDELVRTIHQAPLFKKPDIGNNPFKEVNIEDQDRSNDGIHDIMVAIIKWYENGHDYVEYSNLKRVIPTSRILLDLNLKKAAKAGLIDHSQEYIYLEDKGKHYAIEHGIVEN